MNSNAVRAAIHDRIDPVIEAIITEELREKGGQPLSPPEPISPSSLADILAPALAAALAPALAPALATALTPALTAALTVALTPVLPPDTHENGHESKPESSQLGEGGGSHEGENPNQ